MTIPPEQNPEPLYPPDLLTADQPVKPWRIAQVKSRREKALASYLAGKDIGYYLPMYWRPQASKKRQRHSLVPLFAGYLFFQADDFDRYAALRTNHISRIIDVKDPVTLVHELRNIQKALSGDRPVFPVEFLNTGQLVRIKKGPLKDVEGIIERKDRGCRLILSVTHIMQSVSVEVDADMVESLWGRT
ncbi:MAG: hypothetical protein KGY61_10805 [Desulfobacterales bacterium]|nr:hypothetical protein [Desulfobacterales bacterium]